MSDFKSTNYFVTRFGERNLVDFVTISWNLIEISGNLVKTAASKFFSVAPCLASWEPQG